MGMTEWFRLASSASVVRRALCYSVVVGAVLIGINHGEALLEADIDTNRAIRMALTAVVPYLVSTFSSVGAIRAARHGRGD
jgi:hypothetical protein